MYFSYRNLPSQGRMSREGVPDYLGSGEVVEMVSDPCSRVPRLKSRYVIDDVQEEEICSRFPILEVSL